tara:strand:+ start:8586 stop:10052 length:1467 start_codon:yes stop_codon:yes gene_type:complete
MSHKVEVSLACIFLAFFMMTFFSDYLPMPHGAFDDQRFVLCLSLVLLVSLSLYCLNPLHFLRGSRLVLFMPFFLFLLIGGSQSVAHPFNWVEPIFYILFFSAICLLGTLMFQKSIQNQVALLFCMLAVVACFFYACITVLMYVFSLEANLSTFSDVVPAGFLNIRFWGHTATWLLPIFPLATLARKGESWRIWRLMVLFTAGIWWWLAIYLTSRGTIISLLIATILMCFLFHGVVKVWLSVMLTQLSLGVLIWLVLSYIVPVWILDVNAGLIKELNTTTSGRLPLWEEAWVMSLQNFPFGMGAQSWLTHTLLTDSYKLSVKFGAPHNMYLMWAAEYGWISIVCILGVLYWSIIRLREKIKLLGSQNESHLMYLLVFSVSSCAGLIHSNVSSLFIAPASMMIGLCVLAIFWSLILPTKIDDSNVSILKKMPAPKYLLLLFVPLACLWLSYVWSYHQAMIDDLTTDEGRAAQSMMPRFWVYGNYPRAVTE